CSVCRQPPRLPVDDVRIMCDRCDAKCHIHCLSLTAVPEGDWFCASCVSERTAPFSLFNDPVAEKAFYSPTPGEVNRAR
ncbi:unnamed protein product, partial [Hapterophycus canaliculatus]